MTTPETLKLGPRARLSALLAEVEDNAADLETSTDVERACTAAARLDELATRATVLGSEVEGLLEAQRTRVGELLIGTGRGGGFNVTGERAMVVASSRFDLQLFINDLVPPEAIDPATAASYAHSIEVAEASAEQRLINKLDSLGLGGLAPRTVDYLALVHWVEDHPEGPAAAVNALRDVVTISSVTSIEVSR